jgi:phage gp16-like protein
MGKADDMSAPKTNAQRQAALKARRKAAGLVPVTVWVYPLSRDDVKEFATATVEVHGALSRQKLQNERIGS